jgi:hypothetical protein
MRTLIGTELVSNFIWGMLAIFWIWIFVRDIRNRIVKSGHIMLLVFALVILFKFLYEMLHSYSF